ARVLVGVDVVLLHHPRVLEVFDGDVAGGYRVGGLAVVRVLTVVVGDVGGRRAAVPDDEHGGDAEAECDHGDTGEGEDESPRLRLPYLDGAALALAARVLRGFRGGLLLGCHFAGEPYSSDSG